MAFLNFSWLAFPAYDMPPKQQRELIFGVQLSGLALTQDEMDNHMVNQREEAEFEISRDHGAEHFQIFLRLQLTSKNHERITEIQLCYQEYVCKFL